MKQLQRFTLRTAGVLFLSTFCVAMKCSEDDPSSAPDEKATGGAKSGSAGEPNSGGENEGGAATNRGGSGGGAVSGADAGEGGAPSGNGGGGGSAGFSGNDASAGAGGESPEGGTGGEPGGVAGTGGQGAATEPEILVPFGVIVGLSSPPTIAVDDEYVYWTSAWVGADPPTPLPQPSGAYVMRVPKNGGEPSALFDAVIEVDGQPRQLALSANFATDATSIYVSAGLDVLTSLLFKVAKDGSGVAQIAVTGGLDAKRFLALDDQNVYFEGNAAGEIHSVPRDGGDVAKLIDNTITPFPDGFSYFPQITTLVTDGAYVYYQGNADGTFKVPVSGGQPALISPRNMPGAIFSSSAGHLGLADGFLYWNYYGYVYEMSVDGGELTTIVDPADTACTGSGTQTVIDGDYVYFTCNGLQKAARDGSSRVLLLDAAANYNAGVFAIDETHVYISAFSGQGIIKVPK